MTKIFLDTNVWLRFILQDNQQAVDCLKLMEKVEAGTLKPYTSTVVMLEINYVLTSIYKISFKQVVEDLKRITQARNITVIDKTDLLAALQLYRKIGIKLADCLIATQIPPKTTLVTYDTDFKRVSLLNVKTPDEILQTN